MAPNNQQKPEPVVSAIGTLAHAFFSVTGQLTVAVASATALSPFTQTEIDGAVAGSVLQHELLKDALPLMIRVRLQAINSSVTIRVKAAKPEDGGNKKFYEEFAEITFATSANAISAERGGFYCDTAPAIVGTDKTLKGFAFVGKYANTSYVDMLGFQSLALECSALDTAEWAEIDITNS